MKQFSLSHIIVDTVKSEVVGSSHVNVLSSDITARLLATDEDGTHETETALLPNEIELLNAFKSALESRVTSEFDK